jgi:hypothetical protein
MVSSRVLLSIRVLNKFVSEIISASRTFFSKEAVTDALSSALSQSLARCNLSLHDNPKATHLSVFAPAALWFKLLAVALVVHGKRGLWLLVGAPFAFFIPLVWAAVYFVCKCSIFQEG